MTLIKGSFMPKFTLLLSIVLLTATGLSHAGEIIYKWKDSSGQIKYTQSKPPSGIAYTVIRDRSAKEVEAKDLYQDKADDASDDIDAKQDEILAKQNASKNKVDLLNEQRFAKNCTISKNNLESLEKTSLIKITEDGKERYLTDKEIEAQKQTAKANIAKYCK